MSAEAPAGTPPLQLATPQPGRRVRTGRVGTAIGTGALLVVVLLVVVPQQLSGYDVNGQNLAQARLGPFHSARHPLGTDELGRDLLSRLSSAALTSIRVAVPALLIAVALGVALGLLAGYLGRGVNAVVMGVADVQISFPLLILLILVVTVVRPGTGMLGVILGAAYWVGYARVARVHVLSLLDREYVLAARTFGASGFWIVRKHLLPKLAPQLAIMASFDLGVLVILESSLSYLGVGIQAPRPSWGNMILEGQSYLQDDIWITIWPAAAIFLLVGGVQVLSRRFTGEAPIDPGIGGV